MNPIRIAMLGTGGIAAKHMNFFCGNDDVQVVAGCDVKEDIVKGFWDRTLPEDVPHPPIFTDSVQMYEQINPDAVVICTPHTMHFDHGMLALEHGCHVLMEKPMVTRADHAYQLVDKAEQAGKIFVVGYNTPCTPEFMYIREVIRNKTLGNLEMVTGYLTQNWKELTTGTWRRKPELSGGGQAYDSGAHLVTSLCWSVESSVQKVHAFLDTQGTEVDINTSINICFENGVFASLMISGNCPANVGHMCFIFDNGRIDVDGWCGTWMKVFKGGTEIKYPAVKGDPQDPAGNFIDAILGRAEPRTTPRNGIVQCELMDMIYESAKTGQVICREKVGSEA